MHDLCVPSIYRATSSGTKVCTIVNIYNGTISPSLNPAKIFNSFFDNSCHEVVPGSWTNHTRSDLKGGGANPVP